jgi:hypothetical protein
LPQSQASLVDSVRGNCLLALLNPDVLAARCHVQQADERAALGEREQTDQLYAGSELLRACR